MKWIMNAYRRQIMSRLQQVKRQYGIEIGDPLPFDLYEGWTREEMLDMDLVGIYKPTPQELELMKHFGLIYDIVDTTKPKNEVTIIEED
jgi:hypothetical protein